MRRGAHRPLAVAGLLATSAVAGGCSLGHQTADMVNGKQQFVQNCGSCHTLSRAGTRGQAGPNLDASFVRARKDGLGESTFEGVVHRQILQPARRPQQDPKTDKALPPMPANLVTGDDARDVAAYVAMAAGAGGKDTGALAAVGARKAEGTVRAKGGTLDIPVVPTGGLAFVYAEARATPGEVTLVSKNAQPVPHNIAVEGNGLDEKGPVVRDGGVSRLTVDLQAGNYTFYCSVPGHRAGGMLGKLVIARR